MYGTADGVGVSETLGRRGEADAMKLLIALGVLGLLDVLAWRFGVDSRDGKDWWSAPWLRRTSTSRSMFLRATEKVIGWRAIVGVPAPSRRTRIVASGRAR